jgi:indolepyruvate ferredoxin oxidoreductase
LQDYGLRQSGKNLASTYLAMVQAAKEACQNPNMAGADPAAGERLVRAVATQYFRLLAVKDEWEVARLYAAPEFAEQLQATFAGQLGRDYKLHFHLGAWPFAKRNKTTGLPMKAELGPWVLSLFKAVARLRGLRGSWLDPFRHSAERQLALQLRTQFEADMAECFKHISSAKLPAITQLANLPEKIRGYGHIREAAARTADAERAPLLATIRA